MQPRSEVNWKPSSLSRVHSNIAVPMDHKVPHFKHSYPGKVPLDAKVGKYTFTGTDHVQTGFKSPEETSAFSWYERFKGTLTGLHHGCSTGQNPTLFPSMISSTIIGS